jgi:hypothetical protein
MALAVESKDIARIYDLTKQQHRELVLSQIPTTSAEYIFLNLSKSLEELFSIISTHANRLSTRMDLERKIQKWTLVTTDDVSLYRSIMDLISLYYKNDDKYQEGDDQIHIPSLFRSVVSRIQQIQGLPYAVQNDLNAMRIKIRDEDTLDMCSKMLLSSLNKLIGWKDRNRTPQVKMVEHEGEHQKALAIQQEKNGSGEKYEKKYESQKGKKPYFVSPWPEGKNYTSRNSNTLSKEVEAHFANCCYKCGNSSHLARQCKTYPENKVILTLCCRCRQGFHELCRSKRKDLVTGENVKEKKGQNKKMTGKGKKEKKQKERQEMPEMWGYYGGGRYPPVFGSWFNQQPPLYAYNQTIPPPPHVPPPAELTHNTSG